MVRAMSRICSKMSWSPRPLSSSLGGRFLGGSGAAGLLLHHPLLVPNHCVMRHLRVRVGDGLGDLDPIGCKAESCGFGRCCMFVVAPLPKSKASWRRREKGNHGTASSDCFFQVGDVHRFVFTVMPACPISYYICCITMMGPRTSRKWSSANDTGCNCRSRRVPPTPPR